MRASKTLGLSLSAALVVGMLGLTGCGQNNKVGTQGVKNQTAHRLNINSNDQGRDNLRNMKYSQVLSKKVMEIGSVRTAHVMTSGNEAFVAVNLNGTNPSLGGTRASGNGTGSMNDLSVPNGTLGTRGPGALGTGNVTGRTSTLGRSMGQGVNPGGSDYRPNGVAGAARGLDFTSNLSGGTNPAGRYNPNPGTIYDGSRLGGGLGAQADNMPHGAGAGRGYTTYGTNNGTNNNASTIPADVRSQIERTIKRSAPQIQQVYISDNADFVNQLGSFNTGGGTTLGNNPLTNGARNVTNDLAGMIDNLFPERLRNMGRTNTGNTGIFNTNPTNNNNNRFDMNPNR
ncbi:YhcN/YlaJ family sporulation lipoprotein [Paenibacillus physcomitrellae]|uniref:Sporulation protein n=1 Tax=Paenibacillus physcomitrellae TaxID=1619311 RepID=A0ABQ1G491_9BACL|nr:hypothetical protein [Paenibacillus physcomitrellae]GGA35994.1 hypothetical protein GCM10010917_21470 [Paenibacillus physcomitrellae]